MFKCDGNFLHSTDFRMKENEKQDLVVVECGGASLVECRVCFDHTNKYVFCCGGKNVRVTAVDSGECVGILRHASDVVGVFVDEENISLILTCTVDGIVSQWNYEEGSKVKEWIIPDKLRIRTFIIPRHAPTTWFVVATDAKSAQLISLTRTKNGLAKREITKVTDDCRKLSIHNKGHFVAYVSGRKVWIRSLVTDNEPPWHLAGADNDINLVVCHPTKDSVATGDEIGRIRVWHKVLGRRPVFTIYHWHSLPVSDIAFSSEGTTMYSGGEENVVVRWSFQASSKDETKDFLPRAGAKIRFLATSPDSSIIGVALEDNSIQLASSQLKMLNSIQGFARNADPSSESGKEEERSENQKFPDFPVGLTFDNIGCGDEKTNGVLVTNGRHGHLQFYDARMDRQIMNLDVIGKNQPPAQRGKRLSYFEVLQMALSGGWLATVDHRPDHQYSDETNLKFWKYDDDSKSFKLNTWIDRPHSEIVTSIFFRPSRNDANEAALVSTGDDGKFKIWELSTDTNIYKSTEFWNCERVGYYRGQSATCGDFSSDDKLAVGFGSTLTLWNFEHHRMTTAISVLPANIVIRKLQFGVAKSEKHLIAVLSDCDLAAWDASSELCLWRVKTRPDVICKDLTSGLFAAIFGSRICIFRLSSPKPKHVTISNEFSKAVAAAFESETLDKEQGEKRELSRLYFITDKQKLMCLRKNAEEETDTQVTAARRQIEKTPFAELLAASRASKQKSGTSGRSSNYESNMQLLSGSTHTLPAVANIGARFAESCLAKKEKNKRDGDEKFPDLASEITFASLKLKYS